MLNTTISVIIPYYNHIRYIEECLLSIVSQKQGRFEIIVVNDSSTDNSHEFLLSLQKKYDFELIQNSFNIGCSASIKVGLSHSTGDYVCVLASDDTFVKDRFPAQLDCLIESGFDVLYGNCSIISDRKDQPSVPKLREFVKAYSISNDEVLKLIYTQDFSLPLLQSALFKRSVFCEIQDLKKDVKSDDWVTLICSFRYYRAGFSNKATFVYRIHDNNSHSSYWKLLSNRFEVISDFVPEGYRDKAFSSVIWSIYDHKRLNGHSIESIQYALASFLLDFRSFRFKIILFNLLKTIFKRNNKL